jgi:hypothetical protein
VFEVVDGGDGSVIMLLGAGVSLIGTVGWWFGILGLLGCGNKLLWPQVESLGVIIQFYYVAIHVR